jgi:hypothetical protein
MGSDRIDRWAEKHRRRRLNPFSFHPDFPPDTETVKKAGQPRRRALGGRTLAMDWPPVPYGSRDALAH